MAGPDDRSYDAGEERGTTRTTGSRSVGSHVGDDRARDRFGGINPGAAFFGWLVAIAASILLIGLAGAVVAAIGSSASVTQSQAQRDAGTIGLASAIVLILVLAVGYYAGGYVAGRMSRFDGGRQGAAVWLLGLAVTVLAIIFGAVFGSKYNILDRVSLPRIPVDTGTLGWGTVVTAVVVLLLTLLAAVLGGKVGHRYHDRVDRAIQR
jgi:amino acid transporter